MKRAVTVAVTAAVLAACLMGLAGCDRKSMDYIIANKPSVVGIVEEVYEGHVVMYAEAAEGYPNGSRWDVSLEVENQDSYLCPVVGDEIVVYYDGAVMETDPLRFTTVCAITLRTPADREGKALP